MSYNRHAVCEHACVRAATGAEGPRCAELEKCRRTTWGRGRVLRRGEQFTSIVALDRWSSAEHWRCQSCSSFLVVGIRDAESDPMAQNFEKAIIFVRMQGFDTSGREQTVQSKRLRRRGRSPWHRSFGRGQFLPREYVRALIEKGTLKTA